MPQNVFLLDYDFFHLFYSTELFIPLFWTMFEEAYHRLFSVQSYIHSTELLGGKKNSTSQCVDNCIAVLRPVNDTCWNGLYLPQKPPSWTFSAFFFWRGKGIISYWEGNRQEGQGSPNEGNRLWVSDIFSLSFKRQEETNKCQIFLSSLHKIKRRLLLKFCLAMMTPGSTWT